MGYVTQYSIICDSNTHDYKIIDYLNICSKGIYMNMVKLFLQSYIIII